MQLSEIFNNSTYKVDKREYCIAKVDSSYNDGDCFMVTKDELETTIICENSLLKDGYIEARRNYRLIALNVAIPFDSPGFIAAISGKMALKGIPVLVLSTYSRDYFLIQDRMLREAIWILDELGIKRV